jgi:S1-C subfamily serine protease
MHDVIMNATRQNSREDVRVRRPEVGVQKTNVATAIQPVIGAPPLGATAPRGGAPIRRVHPSGPNLLLVQP